MARPLTKTYNPEAPYVVERHDLNDGSISYEVWDERPDSYRRLCTLNEFYESNTYRDKGKRPKFNAKKDAEMIVLALNLLRKKTTDLKPS